jgi:ribose transport system permease protein
MTTTPLGTTATTALRGSVPLWVLTALVVTTAAILLPAFRTPTSMSSLLVALAPVVLVAAGQAVVVMLAGIDLSVGAVVGIATVVVVTAGPLGGGWIGVALAVLTGLAIGLANGAGVLAGVHPLIMTLAAGGVVQGIGLLLLRQPGGTVPAGVLTVLTAKVGPVPVTALVALAVLVLVWYASAQTRVGRILAATGYDPATARRIGLPWRRVTMIAYGVSGLLAGLAGLAVVARIYSGDALAGTSFLLDSITAVLIAGVALTGGRGSVLAVLPAAALLAVAGQVITLTGTDTNFQYIIDGLVLVAAMLLYRTGGPPPALLRTLRMLPTFRTGRPE